MKKMIICLVIALTLMSLCACSEANTYTVLEVGGYDNFSGANHMEDITLDNENYSKVLVIPQKTVKINGNDWKVEYCGSQKGYLYKNDLDNYTRDEDGVFVDIGINKDTGTVDSYMWVDQKYVESQTGAELTEEECLDIAKTYLGDYVKTDEYEVVNVRYLEIPEYKAIYDFEFARVIDGIKTSDTAYIGVSVFGDVISHLFVSLGELADAEAPTEKEMEIIQKSGSWFSMGDERIGQGKDSVKNFLLDNPDIAELVEAQVRARLIQGNASREPARAAERPVAVSADDFNDED